MNQNNDITQKYEYTLGFDGADASSYAHIQNENIESEVDAEDVSLKSFQIKKELESNIWDENAEKERVQGIEKELATLRAKDQLLDNGFSKDEIKYLIENEQSPSAFAKVMTDRVQSAFEKAKAKDIKENTQDTAASNGNLNVEPASLVEALHEKYDK